MVRNGIDCIEKYDALFQGKRLGLITSVSGVNRKLKSSIDIWQKGMRFGLFFHRSMV